MSPSPVRITRAVDSRFQELKALLNNRTKRHREGRCIVQGVLAVKRLMAEGWPILALIVCERSELSGWASSVLKQCADTERIELAPDLFAELSERDDPTEILAVIAPRFASVETLLASDGPLILLDRPAYPGNIGTVLRSADAFGAGGVLVLGHAADPFDPKSIRASVGSLFSVPVALESRSMAALAGAFQSAGRVLCALDEEAPQTISELDLPRELCFVIGTEGAGLSRAIRDSVSLRGKIPMQGQASSLNMSVAASIALYEYRRRFPGSR